MNNPKPFVLLMVDDDEDDNMLVKEAVEEVSLSVSLRFLHDGVELLEYLQQSRNGNCTHKPRPNLILLDLCLPKLDGLEALKQIRSIPDFQRLPVVIFTSSEYKATAQNCYNSGANDFIQKPANFEDFVVIIRSLVHHWGSSS